MGFLFQGYSSTASGITQVKTRAVWWTGCYLLISQMHQMLFKNKVHSEREKHAEREGADFKNKGRLKDKEQKCEYEEKIIHPTGECFVLSSVPSLH